MAPSTPQFQAGARHVTGVVTLGKDAPHAAADQSERISFSAHPWSAAHPGPDPTVTDKFRAACSVFTVLTEARTVASSEIPDDCPQDLDDWAVSAAVYLKEALVFSGSIPPPVMTSPRRDSRQR